MEKRYFGYRLDRLVCVDTIFSLFYSDWTSRFSSRGEHHDFWEALYLDKGRILVETDADSFELARGEVCFHRPGEHHRHSSLDAGGASVCVMSFACASGAMRLLERRRMALPEEIRRILSQLLKHGARAFSYIEDNDELLSMGRNPGGRPFSDQLVLSYLELFLAECLACAEERDAAAASAREDPDVLAANRKGALVDSAVAFLRKNVYRKVRIPELCEELNCSKTTLSVAFKERTGAGIVDYFNELKIEKAKELIRTEALNLTQIAERLSFCNLHYFSNAFKARTGMYPRQYAKSIRVFNGTYMLSDADAYGRPGGGPLSDPV